MNQTAPETFQVRFQTTAGDFVVEARRDWAPRGVDRFYNLVREGFYDGVRFFRVIEGFMAQFGIAADPDMAPGWHATRIGIGGFLAPFLFAFQPPLLMKGEWSAIVLAFVAALIGISALSAAVAGHMFTPLTWPHRLFLIAASLAAISPSISVSLACSVVLVIYMVWDARRGRRRGEAVPVLQVTERPVIASGGDAPPPPISV